MQVCQKLLMVVVTGTLLLPLAPPSFAQSGFGNGNGNTGSFNGNGNIGSFNGNGNIGSFNGNCNSGNNNGNNTIGNFKGNGSLDQRKLQTKQMQELLRDNPLGETIWKMLGEC